MGVISSLRGVYRLAREAGVPDEITHGYLRFGPEGMTPAARQARAAQDYGPVLYHGTAQGDFGAFRGQPWFTPSPKTASDYADRDAFRRMDDDAWEQMGVDIFERPDVDEVPASEMFEAARRFGEGQAVMPVRVGKMSNLNMTELGDSPTMPDLVEFLQRHKVVGKDADPEDWANNLTRDNPTLWLALDELGLQRDISRAGFDGLTITDVAAGGGANHVALNVLSERVPIRSPNATFDPARRHWNNLLAGAGGGGLLGALALQNQEALS
jgi:hypothetical protein